MMKRWRPSYDNEQYIETTFQQKVNEIYKKYFTKLEDAVNYYQSCPKFQKLQFTQVWDDIDIVIGVNPDDKKKKSYSYKYITDVVVQRLSPKWEDDTIQKAREFAKSLISDILKGLSKPFTEDEARQACKDVKDRTFAQFNDFQNERVQGTRKTMMDMLGHVIQNQIQTICQVKYEQPQIDQQPHSAQLDSHKLKYEIQKLEQLFKSKILESFKEIQQQ
ncbi:Hypothetical_protein [Hexamita inflata]|uniref:Hypothetical_protein n=1 Tax=Hexamita inflata TaxID=28002 RepID=A0ABP1I9P3_9EUKA